LTGSKITGDDQIQDLRGQNRQISCMVITNFDGKIIERMTVNLQGSANDCQKAVGRLRVGESETLDSELRALGQGVRRIVWKW
jgi:hypothetical protein